MADEESKVPPVSDEVKAEARANLREKFPEITDEDLDEVSAQETETSRFEIFIQKLMEKYKWSRSVCQQQVGMGTDDIRNC